jgi:hypothetical protein
MLPSSGEVRSHSPGCADVTLQGNVPGSSNFFHEGKHSFIPDYRANRLIIQSLVLLTNFVTVSVRHLGQVRASFI